MIYLDFQRRKECKFLNAGSKACVYMRDLVYMYKDSIYSSFQCTADRCRMTCCRGWGIRVESDCFDKWKKDTDTAYLCDCTMVRKLDGETGYQMKQNSLQTCVLLDENGLCEIVKCHGDKLLSDTCARFPRKHNVINTENMIAEEYSLSGACPEVLRLIMENPGKCQSAFPEACVKKHDFPLEYYVRNALIELMRLQKFSIEDRLILCFSLLQECLSCEWEEDVFSCIEVYQDMENLEENIELWRGIEFDKKEAFVKVCQTLLDMIQFYKEEPMYRPYLYEIADFVERLDEEKGPWSKLQEEWQRFKARWDKDSIFYENVIVSELYGDGVSEDLEYLTESFQSIVMEYSMTRVSVFLKERISAVKLSLEEIREYMALYIRMIGHNTEGMAEYWEENFDDVVLGKEYFFLILQ